MPATKQQSNKKVLAKKASKGKKAGATAQHKAGIVFPVSRFMRQMRQDRLSERIGKGAAICMAAVVEYLVSELLEISGNFAEEGGKKRINNRHLLLAVRNDDELRKLFSDIVIHEGGVLPHIEAAIVGKTKGGKSQAEPSQEV